MSVNDDVQTILEAVLDLQDIAATERLWGAFSPSSDGTRTGSQTPDPTGNRAADERKWTDAERIEDKLAKLAADLDRFADRYRPREGGGQCSRPRCSGPATHDGYCPDCFGYFRKAGRWPDEVVYQEKDPDTGEATGRRRRLTDDVNDRRRRDCMCTGTVRLADGSEVVSCDDHTAETRNRCRRRIGPSDRHLDCSTCRGRQTRILEAEKEAS